MNKQGRDKEIIFVGAAFTFYFFITMYGLTNSSLWIDESIEYWYSKYLFGKLPFEAASSNMYARIISTYQPPLFNILMYFWLKISDAQWWFRFFGVVMGFVGMAGIYQSIKRLSNSVVASIGVFFSATIYQLVYYWQECGEYSLVIATLCWTVYFWIRLLQEVNRKNIILFTIGAILPVYSQYGAAFPVLAMVATAFLYIVLQKNKTNIITVAISYGTAFLVAGLPLILLFLRPQMMNQSKGYASAGEVAFAGGFFRDFLESFKVVLRWNFFSFYEDSAINLAMLVLILLVLASLIFGKSRITKWMCLYNGISWVIYYFAVKFRIYGEGLFGQRYGLFMIPLWVILVFAVCVDLYMLLKEKPELAIPKLPVLNLSDVKCFFVGACICTVVCYGAYSWTEALRYNWSKDDIRNVVDVWYEESAFEKDTIVYFGANAGFAYYIRQNPTFRDQMEEHIHYMDWIFHGDVDIFTEYVNGIYGDDWPSELYIVSSFGGEDMLSLIESFTLKGYAAEELYDEGGGEIYYVSNLGSADE